MWEAYARLKPPPPSREEEKWRREEEERRILERSGRSLVPPPPAEVSMNLRDADTPALVLDLDALERNLQRLSYWCKNNKLRYRPCVSAHHCLHVASRQLELGASGVCCGGVLEAEVMVRLADVQDVLIVCPVVGESKLRRLVSLAKEVYRLGVVIQDLQHIHALAQLCVAARVEVDVYVLVDALPPLDSENGVGGCVGVGLKEPEHVAHVAHTLDSLRGLNWRGLYVNEGEALQRLHCPHTRRRLVLEHVVPLIRRCKEALAHKQLTPEMVTGGGTGTLHAHCEGGELTEVAPGSYATLDGGFVGSGSLPKEPTFEHALFLLTTVQSVVCVGKNGAGVVVDAGSEAVSSSHTTALPPPSTSPCLPSYVSMGLHQGLLSMPSSEGTSELPSKALAKANTPTATEAPTAPLKTHKPSPQSCWLPPVGNKVLLVPGNSGTTTALHDWVLGVRGHRISDTLRLGTRGALL